MPLGPINPSNPVNWHSPLNRGLLLWVPPLRHRSCGNRAGILVRNQQATVTGGSLITSEWNPGVNQYDLTSGYIDIGQPSEMYSASALTCVTYGAKLANGNYWGFGFYGFSTRLGYHLLTDQTSYLTMYGSYISITHASNGWHQFAITVDGTNTKGYLDGTLMATIAIGSTNTSANEGTFSFGKTSSGQTTGRFEDSRVYRRVLSLGELAALRAERAAGYPTVFNRVQGRLPYSVTSTGGPFPWFMDQSAMSGGLQTLGL